MTSLLSPVFAAKVPSDGRADPRIKNVNYSPNDVYVIHGHYGYSTHIIFAEDEVIEHLSPGDSIAWQFNPKNNHLFLQPVEDEADTNLSVLTNKRMYNFELRAGQAAHVSDRSLSFLVQFHYPQDELQKQLMAQEVAQVEEKKWIAKDFDPENLNFKYSMRGDESIAPNKVFDDGLFTYFQFDESIKTPAIFLVDADKKESLVNYHVKGRYIVVQSTGAQFMLRENQQATCIYNDNTPKESADTAIETAKLDKRLTNIDRSR